MNIASVGRLFFLTLAVLVFSSSVFGETLIIQSSDQHSSYSRLPHFLGAIEVVSREFKEAYPDGNVVLLINGDFSSQLKFWSPRDRKQFLDSKEHNPLAAKDKGDFAYKILARLAQKYTVIYTFGNHDAFDWHDSELFLKQMSILKEAGVFILAGNVEMSPEYKHLISPYVDVPLDGGQSIRFFGFTFPGFRKREALFGRGEPNVIQTIRPLEKDLSAVIQESNRNPLVASLVFAFHLGLHKTRKAFKHFKPAELKKVQLAFAGHDHTLSMKTKVHKGHVIDSRAFFDFSAVVLDERGQVVSKEFFDHHSQMEKYKSLDSRSLEQALIKKTEYFIKLLERAKNSSSPKGIKQLVRKLHRQPCAHVFQQ